MSDAILRQGWGNDEPTPIYWETVRAIFNLNVEPKKAERPRDKNGRFTKS